MSAGKRWRWVYIGGWHLARETCGGEWVKVCEALETFPFSATPERIRLTDGSSRWALKQKIESHNVCYDSNIRVKLDRHKDRPCPKCMGHAKEIAKLWRGVNRPPSKRRGES